MWGAGEWVVRLWWWVRCNLCAGWGVVVCVVRVCVCDGRCQVWQSLGPIPSSEVCDSLLERVNHSLGPLLVDGTRGMLHWAVDSCTGATAVEVKTILIIKAKECQGLLSGEVG